MIKSHWSPLLYEYLGQVHFQLNRSSAAYADYLKEGKTYLHARILRRCNLDLRQLMMEKSYLLPEELQKEVIHIITHYDIWREKWEELERSLQPSLTDEFVFPNDNRFPKESARKLEDVYLQMKEQAAELS